MTGEIEAALARLDAGTYGVCERCGGPIAVERLQAMPEARYCARCARDLASSSAVRPIASPAVKRPGRQAVQARGPA